MRPIPKEMKEIMAADPFYKECCSRNSTCKGRIEWHHVFIYAGRQINEPWAIIPLCKHHHDLVSSSSEFKEQCELISLKRASSSDFAKYPKRDWHYIKNYLTQVYG